jgi:hypothetical protein
MNMRADDSSGNGGRISRQFVTAAKQETWMKKSGRQDQLGFSKGLVRHAYHGHILDYNGLPIGRPRWPRAL